MTDRIAHVRGKRRSTIPQFAIAYVGSDADTIPAAWITYRFAETHAILDRLVAGVTGAFIRRAAISVDAVGFAGRFAYVRRIVFGRTIAFVACTNFGRAANAVHAIFATNRLADIGEVA